MPKLTKSLPSYRKHRQSGQAIVTLSGKDFLLGPYGTKASKLEYDRLLVEWLANGRELPQAEKPVEYSLAELMVAYRRFALGYYVKNGRPTGTVVNIDQALKYLRKLYGRLPVNEFGPLKLRAVREAMIRDGHSRSFINGQIGRIRAMFKWGVEHEKVRPDVLQALQAVSGLRAGRTEARETEGVLPVSDATVDATLPFLPPVVADMVRFQRLTGARPAEVCLLRPGDVDTQGKVWQYVPSEHKTQHKGKSRVVFIGPRAQDVLRPYLLRPAEAYCFSPADSERKRRAARHAVRVTPLNQGNKPGSNRKTRPERYPKDRYSSCSYRRAIHRACDLAFPCPPELARGKRESPIAYRKRLVPDQKAALKAHHAAVRWAPNQLRHAAATEIRQRFGLEGAQVILGHASADVTQVYAARDMSRAAAIAAEVG